MLKKSSTCPLPDLPQATKAQVTCLFLPCHTDTANPVVLLDALVLFGYGEDTLQGWALWLLCWLGLVSLEAPP